MSDIRFNRWLHQSGTGGIYQDASGRAGIGTDNPSWGLDLQRNANTQARFIRNDAGDSFLRVNSHTGNIVGLQLGDNTDVDKQMIRADNTNNALIFNTANSEKLRIISSGNVGIGTDNPEYNLDLGQLSSSTIRLISEDNGTAIRVGAGGDSNDVTLLRVDGTSNGVRYRGESNVGSLGFSIKYMGARFGNNNSLSIFGDNGFSNGSGSQVEAITINQDGSTGIGTDNPAETLSVAGNVRVQNSTDATQYLTINYQGIDFQNTGAGSSTTSSAHLLDDYEEGTWTPTIEGGTAYTHQDGRYIKVGNIVHFFVRVQASAATGNSNRWKVVGLPFTSAGSGVYGGAFRNYGDHLPQATFTDLNFHIPANGTNIWSYDGQTTIFSNTSGVLLTRQIILQGFYRTDP